MAVSDPHVIAEFMNSLEKSWISCGKAMRKTAVLRSSRRSLRKP